MKRSIFTVMAALALLLAMPAVAQEEEPYEDRTNPDARSIAPGSGLTITGTVVEWNDKQLVIQSATGVEHIQIVPDTQKPVDLQPGQNVSVDYTRTAQGVMIAQQIRLGGEVTSETTVDTESELTTDTELDEPAIDEPDVTAGLETEADADLDAGVESDLDTEVETTTADTDFESDLDTGLDEDTTDDESLPATGSKLPLAGLLGLLGVAAALGLRSFLR